MNNASSSDKSGVEPHRAPEDAITVRIRGVVQGVGFRPFVFRVATRLGITGWVLNGDDGVQIFAQGRPDLLRTFVSAIKKDTPPASHIVEFVAAEAPVEPITTGFTIRSSTDGSHPTVRVAPDLPLCDDCLRELFDPTDRRFQYPFITCTNCGPRYSIVQDLPYDRPNTTMESWPMCDSCKAEYADPANRRFHAQPLACPDCGPEYVLMSGNARDMRGYAAIERAAALLREGRILAVKGIGGYHLACDAANTEAVSALRERKVRKEKPFAVMVADLATARELVELSDADQSLMMSNARPIVLARARNPAAAAPGVAPENKELGVMLPYAPLHYLLFAAGAPDPLVLTSANASSEPIAYVDDDAQDRLSDLADAFLIGERAIARRVDDSVVRTSPFGPTIIRRSRGYAPGAVATIPSDRPILAVGADLKNSIALVVGGQAFVSQYIGDLEHYPAFTAFRETIDDLLRMYEIDASSLLVAHDAHPQYASTQYATTMSCERVAVQHHRAHIASALAERREWGREVVGVALDGTGFGDDGGIWGGELFAGSLERGFDRVAHLLPAVLAGGDAAARHPVQAAAGFLHGLPDLPDLSAPPFHFPDRFRTASDLIDKNVRVFPTTSMGRLFDTVAALLGFTREMTFEGQAAIWLEQLARRSSESEAYPFASLDYRPLLRTIVDDRLSGRPIEDIARAFHAGVAKGIVECANEQAGIAGIDTLVLSGGTFQNVVLLGEIKALVSSTPGPFRDILVNNRVPPNDGGISLGQAALAAAAIRS